MTEDRDDLAGLLRWYPPAWRDRYGTELVALMEDDLDGRRPSLRYRASMTTSGLRQRARSAGLAGDGAAPEVRVRVGALVVLVSWAALLLGGAAFAKFSEHYSDAVLSPGHPVAVRAYDAVMAIAVVGALLVLVGVAVALPAALRFLRVGGWSSVRRPFVTAAVLTVVAVLATADVGAWAHHLTFHQRNGGDGIYGFAILDWALLTAGTLGAWTWAGIRTARRIELDRSTLRIEAFLAVDVAAVVEVTSVAIGVWWVAMAHGASWFLAGTRPGTHPSPVTVQLVVIEGWLLAATTVALFGATRVIRSLRSI
ncbi:MAG TPA: hypothetical protein VIH95_08480 [Acidimicrobiales bacterium]